MVTVYIALLEEYLRIDGAINGRPKELVAAFASASPGFIAKTPECVLEDTETFMMTLYILVSLALVGIFILHSRLDQIVAGIKDLFFDRFRPELLQALGDMLARELNGNERRLIAGQAISALRDPNPLVRYDAVGMLSESSHPYAIQRLLAIVLEDESEDVRTFAAKTLFTHCDPEVRRMIAASVADSKDRAILRCLKEWTESECTSMLNDFSDDIIAICAFILIQSGDKEAIDLLFESDGERVVSYSPELRKRIVKELCLRLAEGNTFCLEPLYKYDEIGLNDAEPEIADYVASKLESYPLKEVQAALSSFRTRKTNIPSSAAA